MSVLFTSIFWGIDLIWDKRLGFLKETLVAPVPRIVIMIGRTLGSATVGFIQGIFVFLLTLLIGFRPETLVALPLVFVFMALIALFFTAMGTAIASLLEDMSAFPLIMNFLVMPIFFLSGALFPFQNLPDSIIWFSFINPLSYGVDGLRNALLGEAMFNWTFDAFILLVFIVFIMFLGAWLFRRIQI
jgi:ABC-2 type transport system permease protein